MKIANKGMLLMLTALVSGMTIAQPAASGSTDQNGNLSTGVQQQIPTTSEGMAGGTAGPESGAWNTPGPSTGAQAPGVPVVPGQGVVPGQMVQPGNGVMPGQAPQPGKPPVPRNYVPAPAK